MWSVSVLFDSWFLAFGFRYFRYLVLLSFLVSTFQGTLYEKENDDIESISEQHNEMASIKLRIETKMITKMKCNNWQRKQTKLDKGQSKCERQTQLKTVCWVEAEEEEVESPGPNSNSPPSLLRNVFVCMCVCVLWVDWLTYVYGLINKMAFPRLTAMVVRLTDLCPVTITMNFMPAIAAKLGNCLGNGYVYGYIYCQQ